MKKIILLLLALSLLAGCKKDEDPVVATEAEKTETEDEKTEDDKTDDGNKKGGVVITFDDRAIEEWYMADSLLKNHEWKATFCVSQIKKCTSEEIQKIHELDNAGHEIAGHGLNHLNSVEYTSTHGIDSYLNDEIIPMLNIMENESIISNSFSYPYGARNDLTDNALLDYFKIIRGTISGEKKPSDHNCYFNNSPIVFGIGIDNHYEHFSEEYVLDLLDYAKENNRILILYGHVPVVNVTTKYQTDISTLELICDYIRENDMEYYTLKDLSDKLE